MEQSAALSSCYYVSVPDHLRGWIARIGMEHGSTVSYCDYTLVPHRVRGEPGSSLSIQLKSPTSQKSCPSPTSGIWGEAAPAWRGQ